MTTVNTYLSFKGNCEEAFNFYKAIFGGDFSFIARFKDMPKDDPNCVVDEADYEKIMHLTLPIGNTVLMGSDSVGEWSKGFTQGNNFSVSINTDSKEEANRLFNGLSQGGNVMMPMNTTFWGSYFGMFTDQFGIQGMVSFEVMAK